MSEPYAQVSVRILDKEYQVACRASERTDLLDSAEILNEKMREIRDSGDVRIILSGLWVATMLTYLLGDVLRLFAGHVTPGEMDGKPATEGMWLGAAVVMLVPIAMVVLSLTVPYPAIRWISIVVSVLAVLFNLAGLPYTGWYDNFLIGVSFVFNALIVWYAWKWVEI